MLKRILMAGAAVVALSTAGAAQAQDQVYIQIEAQPSLSQADDVETSY